MFFAKAGAVMIVGIVLLAMASCMAHLSYQDIPMEGIHVPGHIGTTDCKK